MALFELLKADKISFVALAPPLDHHRSRNSILTFVLHRTDAEDEGQVLHTVPNFLYFERNLKHNPPPRTHPLVPYALSVNLHYRTDV